MMKINVKLLMKIKMTQVVLIFTIFFLVFSVPLVFAQEVPPTTFPVQVVSSSGTPFNVGWNYFTVSAAECTVKNVFNELQAAGGGALIVQEIWKEENGVWKMFAVTNSNNVKVTADNIFAFNSNQKFYLNIAEDACKTKNTNRDTQIEQVRNLSTKQNGDSFIEKLLSVPGDFWNSLLGKMELNKQDNTLTSPKYSAETAVFTTLNVLGKTTLTDLGITGKISSGLLNINGLDGSFATINTLSNDLYLQNQLLGGINILNGKVTIDTSGNLKTEATLTARNIESTSYTVLGIESIGSGKITAGATQTEVLSLLAYPTSKIFVTANTKTGGQSLLITSKNEGKFTVEIENPYSQDIIFDWWVINSK